MDNQWLFSDKPNVAVITTINIVKKKKPILAVWHDADDEMWQFLDGTSVRKKDARIIGLEEIITIDDTVNEISDLPLGWVAWRDKKGSSWKRKIQGE